MNVFDYLVLGVGFLLVLSFGVGSLSLGAKLYSGRRGHRRASERVGGLVFIGYGLMVVLLLAAVLTGVLWLGWLAFFALLAVMGLWLLAAVLNARERRAAWVRDLELGLPVTRRLMHPAWIALAWFAGYVVVSIAGLIATAALGPELVQRRLLSPDSAARLQSALPMIVVGVCAAAVVGGIVHVVLQMVRRRREDELVARAHAESTSADDSVRPPRE